MASAILDFFFQKKNIFFIPIQISYNLWGTKEGTKLPWFPAKKLGGYKSMRKTGKHWKMARKFLNATFLTVDHKD